MLAGVSAVLCAAGHPLDALGFGLFMQLCMVWGLWWWHDLTEELEASGNPLSPHRLWRTLASALCLVQARRLTPNLTLTLTLTLTPTLTLT